MGILDLLRKPKLVSQELRAALPNIDVLSARRELDRLQNERAGVLIERDDKKLAAHDRKIEAAQVEYDRCLAEQAALERRLAESEAAERESEILIARDKAEAEAKRVAGLIKNKFAKASEEIVDILEALMKAEAEVRAVNEQLAELGRPGERLEAVEQRAIKTPDQLWKPAYSVLHVTTLRSIPELGIKGWNFGGF